MPASALALSMPTWVSVGVWLLLGGVAGRESIQYSGSRLCMCRLQPCKQLYSAWVGGSVSLKKVHAELFMVQ